MQSRNGPVQGITSFGHLSSKLCWFLQIRFDFLWPKMVVHGSRQFTLKADTYQRPSCAHELTWVPQDTGFKLRIWIDTR